MTTKIESKIVGAVVKKEDAYATPMIDIQSRVVEVY